MNIGEFPPEMGWSLSKGLSKENTNSYDPTNLADIIDKMNIDKMNIKNEGGDKGIYIYICMYTHTNGCIYVHGYTYTCIYNDPT
jgi:hypothetical protein